MDATAQDGKITRILEEHRDNPQDLARRLIPAVYDSLRGMARAQMNRERRRITLQPTALANEAYLRLLGGSASWENRRHFFGACAEAMRRILVEHARARDRVKRGGGIEHVALDEALDGALVADDGFLDLDIALGRLERVAPRKAMVVKLRYFVGLSIADTAQALEISAATVKTDWIYSKAWLHRELGRN